MSHRCQTCRLRHYAARYPEAWISRLWRWHTRWCPRWRAYQRELSQQHAAMAFEMKLAAQRRAAQASPSPSAGPAPKDCTAADGAADQTRKRRVPASERRRAAPKSRRGTMDRPRAAGLSAPLAADQAPKPAKATPQMPIRVAQQTAPSPLRLIANPSDASLPTARELRQHLPHAPARITHARPIDCAA